MQRRYLSLLVVAVLLHLAHVHVTEGSSSRWEDLARKALKLHQSGKSRDALVKLQRLAMKHPEEPSLHRVIGDVASDIGDVQSSAQGYSTCLELTKQADASCMDGLAFLYLRAGQPEQAAKLFQKVVEMLPEQDGALLNLGISLKNSKQYEEALQVYFKGIKKFPKNWKMRYNTANCFYEMGDMPSAVKHYKECIKISPKHTDAYNNLANALRAQGKDKAAFKLLQKATKFDPNNAVLHVNLASQCEIENADACLKSFSKALELDNSIMEAYTNRAALLRKLKRCDSALEDMKAAIKLAPSNSQVHVAFAEALKECGKKNEARQMYETAMQKFGSAHSIGGLAGIEYEDSNTERAVELYERAIALDDSVSAWKTNLAVIYNSQLKRAEAENLLRKSLEQSPRDGVTLNNLGSVLHGQGRLNDALSLYQEALQANPDSALFYFNIGNVFLEKGYMEDYKFLTNSIEHYVQVIRIHTEYKGAFNNLGNALKEGDLFDQAIRAWEAALRLLPDDVDVMANLVHLRNHIVDWTNRDLRFLNIQKVAEKQMANNTVPSMQSFHCLLFPMPPEFCLKVAKAFAAEVQKQIKYIDFKPAFAEVGYRISGSPPSAPLLPRIGVISHDLGNHPTGHLFTAIPAFWKSEYGMLQLFSLSTSDNSRYFQRLAQGRHSVEMIGSMSFQDAATTINSANIDILVDLDGWMKGRRPEILALRPTPKQAIYLGYPGSTGAEWVDFALVDKIVLPPEFHSQWSEAKAYLPIPYQINDYPSLFSSDNAKDLRKAEEVLSKEHSDIILCNFNQLYKLEPSTLDIWGNILKSCSNCKLWLLSFPVQAEAFVRKQLLSRDIKSSQVIFMPRQDKQIHLHRIPAGNLFLDNMHVNGHTTVTETLWKGVPAITAPGDVMASRVAASLLTALGVPELIARDDLDYEMLAKSLARSKAKVSTLGATVTRLVPQSRLFNIQELTKAWAQHVKMLIETPRSWHSASFAD